MSAVVKQALGRVARREDLSEDDARGVMDALMAGEASEIEAAGLLTALAMKGETGDELTGFARSMRQHMVAVEVDGPLLDTCGTGGSGLSTPNTSTMVAFLLAADGVRIAKHGNRASSGRCGSADVMEGLGAHIALSPSVAGQLIDELGIGLLFAPRHHPAVRHVVPVRRGLGIRTAFNFLGPLCNPARAGHQLLGVSDPKRAPLMIEALRRLGSERVMIVHGDDGLDELSLAAPSRIWSLVDGRVEEQRLDPTALGLSLVPFSALEGGDRETNMGLFRGLLGGTLTGPRADHLALNAAAALVVAGRARDLSEGLSRARALLGSGAGLALLDRYCARSRALMAQEVA